MAEPSPGERGEPVSGEGRNPLVVQYLYVHGPGEVFHYPSSRSNGTLASLLQRYLECVLVQAASLRLRHADCALMLVTNLTGGHGLDSRGLRLLEAVESMGVEIRFSDYHHRPAVEVGRFASSRYVFDAIVAAGEGSAPERQLWLMDADCIWLDPEKLLAATPPSQAIGCIHVPYAPDWKVSGFTPRDIDRLAVSIGDSIAPVRWVGGELLSGTHHELGRLVSQCEQLEEELTSAGQAFETEEQVLSLAGSLGRVRLIDLSAVAQRIWTGPRHGAPPVVDPAALGLWHLPSEKGLSFRRAAEAILDGRSERLLRDLDDPSRALRRFNVAGARWTRRVRDDTWLIAQRLRNVLPFAGR